MTDADGEPLRFDDEGPLEVDRARSLRAKRKCEILDTVGGGPDLTDSAESADSAKPEPVNEPTEDKTDGSD